MRLRDHIARYRKKRELWRLVCKTVLERVRNPPREERCVAPVDFVVIQVFIRDEFGVWGVRDRLRQTAERTKLSLNWLEDIFTASSGIAENQPLSAEHRRRFVEEVLAEFGESTRGFHGRTSGEFSRTVSTHVEAGSIFIPGLAEVVFAIKELLWGRIDVWRDWEP